ncbi:hypothetical protein AB1Y20_019574 [Prymnesium parvum]|uniref:Uncharacterized protein n=1 Tax=Prymnesium parvum TaxID=97485 RepID=A0AB34JRF3_PRYPA
MASPTEGPPRDERVVDDRSPTESEALLRLNFDALRRKPLDAAVKAVLAATQEALEAQREATWARIEAVRRAEEAKLEAFEERLALAKQEAIQAVAKPTAVMLGASLECSGGAAFDREIEGWDPLTSLSLCASVGNPQTLSSCTSAGRNTALQRVIGFDSVCSVESRSPCTPPARSLLSAALSTSLSSLPPAASMSRNSATRAASAEISSSATQAATAAWRERKVDQLGLKPAARKEGKGGAPTDGARLPSGGVGRGLLEGGGVATNEELALFSSEQLARRGDEREQIGEADVPAHACDGLTRLDLAGEDDEGNEETSDDEAQLGDGCDLLGKSVPISIPPRRF